MDYIAITLRKYFYDKFLNFLVLHLFCDIKSNL